MKASTTARLRLALAMLAWLAQAFMPVAHAALMGAPQGTHLAWCGDPATAQAAYAVLPAEVRAALGDQDVQADHLASCTLLCALGSTPPPVVDVPAVVLLRAAGLEPSAPDRCCPPGRPQSPTPPAQAPPAHA